MTAYRDAVVFAWFVPERMPELGDYYLGLLRAHHRHSKVFVGMNHGSDPVWEDRLRHSGLDVDVRWARPEIGDSWDATGFVTALESFYRGDEAFHLIWFAHTKGGSLACFADYVSVREMLEERFWRRREWIERMFTDPRGGVSSPRFSPLPIPPYGDELPALLRIYRDRCAPLGLHAKETFFVMRHAIVRRFCDTVGGDFFRTPPGAYGAGRYFFEVGFPNIASMQGFEPFIDPDAPGEGHPRDDVWLFADAKQNHRLAQRELERWRANPYAFEPKAMQHAFSP